MAATIAPEPGREAERKKVLFKKLSLYCLKFAKFKGPFKKLQGKKQKEKTTFLFVTFYSVEQFGIQAFGRQGRRRNV